MSATHEDAEPGFGEGDEVESIPGLTDEYAKWAKAEGVPLPLITTEDELRRRNLSAEQRQWVRRWIGRWRRACG